MRIFILDNVVYVPAHVPSSCCDNDLSPNPRYCLVGIYTRSRWEFYRHIREPFRSFIPTGNEMGRNKTGSNETSCICLLYQCLCVDVMKCKQIAHRSMTRKQIFWQGCVFRVVGLSQMMSDLFENRENCI